MAEPILAQFWWLGNRALRRPAAQMRRAQEMAVPLLRREPSVDAPGRPPAARLRSLSTHVVHQCLGRTHSDRPHWPRSHFLHRNRDRWDVIVRVSVPNTGIDRSSRLVEEGPGPDRYHVEL